MGKQLSKVKKMQEIRKLIGGKVRGNFGNLNVKKTAPFQRSKQERTGETRTLILFQEGQIGKFTWIEKKRKEKRIKKHAVGYTMQTANASQRLQSNQRCQIN